MINDQLRQNPKSVIELPPSLQPGDLVRVVAPSGVLRDLEAFERGVEIWRSRGYRVELGSNWNARCGYLAGTDSQRRQALAQAWADPECKAILCARGGYGSTRLLEDWRWLVSDAAVAVTPPLRGREETGRRGDGETGRGGDGERVHSHQSPITNPKWIIGFSDVTGLLWSLAKSGISGIHGPLLTTLAAEPDWSIQRLFDCVEGRPLASLTGQGWGGGKVSGRLLPANLSVATHLLGTSIQPSLDGVILALEEVAEAPYRIDRMLTQWRMIGAFQGVRGIALGRFSRCDRPLGIPSWSVEEVLRDRLSDLGIPVVSELPFGHDGVNAALPVAVMVQLDADRGTVEVLKDEG